MSEQARSWRLPTLLLTLLCGALLAYFPEEGRPLWQLLRWDDQTAFPVFLALTLTLFLPIGQNRTLEPCLVWIGGHPKTVSILSFFVLALLAPWVYQGRPLSTDEYLLWFQAHTFAQGHLYAVYPPDWLDHLLISPHLFITDWQGGKLLSPYWPGFSLLLAPFAALGVPWLCNPLIVGLSLYVLAHITREFFDQPASQGLVLLLALASSSFFLNGVTFYATPAHLLLNAIYTWLLLRPNPLRLALAGGVGSFALVLHNPLPHLLFAIPWIIWIAISPEGWRRLLPLGAGYLPLSLVLGVGWAILRLSGECFLACAVSGGSATGLTPSTAAPAVAAFGASAFVLPGADILLWRSAGAVKLWLSSVPGLVILASLAPFRNLDRRLLVLACSALSTFAGYFFIPFDQGFGWGYRYFHSAWFVLPLLATAAIGPGQKTSFTEEQGRLTRVAVLSMLVLLPFKAFIMLCYTRDHWSQLPPHHGAKNEILFKNSIGEWGYFLVQNPPDLSGSPTVFISRGRRLDAEFIDKYFPAAMPTGSNAYGTTYTVPAAQLPAGRLQELLENRRTAQSSPKDKD